MKAFFIIVLISVSMQSYGQNYFPLIRPGFTWDILHGDGTQICFYYGGARYFFQGDTTISGIQYKKISAYPIVNLDTTMTVFCGPWGIDSSITYTQSTLFLREDTTARKVFVHDQNYNDTLFYDFNLTDGDTLHSIYAGQGITLIVDSVRLITLLNGSVRNIFYLNDGESYIESIGGSQGLQFPILQAIGFWEQPICYQDNNIQIWGNQCLGFVGIDENANNILVNTFPNPFENYINFTVHNNLTTHLVVFDCYSKQIFNKYFTKSTKLNTEFLVNGVYIYNLSNINGQIKNGKIVKQ